ncbi:MAG TPA: FlgD immunoglobulin-like domain containing protein [Candidatus Krumholzibacteria bacterium]|nr:FlgD immunoglobulin-like domain containing protein [Candidatus Krumholzibacteria bacterium]HPD70455.1 FlgD immunoglobulin-like domain containing protein [Candidatus Krumholzibacteria bacterium]HRY39845.1 FlgD immunoglobulin-like domain containing protein [Candidatus Krumholzibacteria bacterium]
MTIRESNDRRRLTAAACALALSLGAALAAAQPQPGEYGDAPEDGTAYPDLAVLGDFPTCLDPFGDWVAHGPVQLAWFGQAVDFEDNGNAGLCQFGPYDLDECSGPNDLDAGLEIATAYTIDPAGNVVVACAPSLAPHIGDACQIVSWGSAIDIWVTNLSGQACAVNVLVDWNRDGLWYGSIDCPNVGQIDEPVVQNLPVPDGFRGPLSALNPPDIFTGPERGYFWVRFSICALIDAPLPGWNGAGEFDFGETEDYLLSVGETTLYGELGDAPEGVLAYPLTGVGGNFPTCLFGSPGHVLHAGNAGAWFGDAVDLEGDGNADLCSFSLYDHDECDAAGGDAGLLLADVFTIEPGFNIVPCTANATDPVGESCGRLVWGQDIDLRVVNNTAFTRWVNVLVDWDGSGDWGQTVTCSNGDTGSEHALVDFPIPGGYDGPLSALGPGSLQILGGAGYVWSRFTISDQPVQVSGWDGAGTFADGETEDYLLLVAESTVGAPPADPRLDSGLHLEPGVPNPFNPRTEIAFLMTRSGPALVTVHDASGELVATLVDRLLVAGRHTVTWEGRTDGGQAVPSGIFLVRVASGGEVRTGKITLLR